MAKRKKDTITLELDEFLKLVAVLVRMLPRRQRELFQKRFAEIAKQTT